MFCIKKSYDEHYNSPKYDCYICDAGFCTDRALTEHIEHAGHECEECGEFFDNAFDAEDHHDSTEYACGKCGGKFCCKREVEDHREDPDDGNVGQERLELEQADGYHEKQQGLHESLGEVERADDRVAADTASELSYRFEVAYPPLPDTPILQTSEPASHRDDSEEEDEKSDSDDSEEVEKGEEMTEEEQVQQNHATCSEETCGNCGKCIDKLDQIK
jgi:hypothetical protein